MIDVTVIEDPAAARSLDPVRTGLLAELVQPGSASALAAKVGLAKQKVTITCVRSNGMGSWSSSRSDEKAIDRAGDAGNGGVVCDLAGGSPRSARPGPRARPLSALWLLALAARLVKELGD